MDCTEKVNVAISKIIDFLTPLLPLANCSMVNFIVSDHWNKFLSEGLQNDLLSLPNDHINHIPSANLPSQENDDSKTIKNLRSFLHDVKAHHLESLGLISNIDEVLTQHGGKCEEFVHHTKIMSPKKHHEVDIMGPVVASLCKGQDVRWIVDMGSGLGYLSSSLSSLHNINVLAVDASESNSESALKRKLRLEKYYKNVARNGPGKCLNITKFIDGNEDLKNFLLESTIVKNSFNSDDSLIDHFECNSVNANINDTHISSLGLVGLHTCGNLAVTSLELFTNNPDVRFICNVGCCYHFLGEQFATAEDEINRKVKLASYLHDKVDLNQKLKYESEHPAINDFNLIGFPISDYLKSKKFCLGRNARMMCNQSSDRLTTENKNSIQLMFWRALLEKFLIDKFIFVSMIAVGRMKNKLHNFSEYAFEALERLNVDSNFSENEFMEYEEKYIYALEHFKRLYYYRASLAPVMEGLIMLDRLSYLYQTSKTSHIVKLFNPQISPRCYGLISIK